MSRLRQLAWPVECSPTYAESASRLRARCPACKLGVLRSAGPVWVAVEVAPDSTYRIYVDVLLRCSECGAWWVSDLLYQRLRWRAYQDHCALIMARDDFTCQRCGTTGEPMEAAHKRGRSRARNPGPTKHAQENMECCCVRCHRAEHTGQAE